MIITITHHDEDGPNFEASVDEYYCWGDSASEALAGLAIVLAKAGQ